MVVEFLLVSLLLSPIVVSGYKSEDVKSWCSQTPYPQPCEYFLSHKPDHSPIKQKSDFLKISMQLALERALRAESNTYSLGSKCRNELEKTAWSDCLKLYEYTILRLNKTVDPNTKCSQVDSQTWLSTALTNLETCRAGFVELGVSDYLLPLMSNNVSKLISNTLSLNKVPYTEPSYKEGFPTWVKPGDRKLLQSSSPASQANIVVAKDGSGDYTTITAAVSAASKRSGTGRYVIYVKAGTYNENIEIGAKLKNIMLLGDGIGKTIITGSKSVGGGSTTFNSATVAAVGDGFIGRGLTIRNTAGAANHQAVALRSGSDLSVFYQCSFEGYQDTLYVHSERQFYRECDIYGTVDFIFGNAAVVLQNCNIYPRNPPNKTNTITAQGRTDPNQNTGISIHNCKVTAASDLKSVQSSVKTYLGRPWKEYSRTVFMKTYLDSLINPAGWMEWSGNFALKTLYYGEYMNTGPGSSTSNRVNWAGYHTQFEPADARMCFPCWDEPALKATFKVTVEVPSELTALSNMPAIQETVNGHLKTVYFEESSTMSTYLVAVVVGLFDHIEDTTADGIKVRAYCPVGKADQGKFALDVAVKTLDMFTGYFSMPYPLPKMDMVAVPDFSGGAMENYGLIIFREIELLYDEMHSGAYRKQRLTIVVSHEVAHQWFGNLVTMEWWTHLWLNEGFATWISNLATDWLFPEWKIWTQFVQETTGGLRLDALEQSHPIEVEVHHARSVLEIFDAISYEKGSSVIRMLQSYLGDDVFQRSMSTYMKRYAGKNAKTDDLWSVLSEESGIQVNSMMDTWTKQKGYPLISVKSKDNILELEQSQFLSSGSFGDGQWIVPISLCLGSYNTNKNFLLEGQVRTVDISELLYSSDSNLSSSKGNDQGKCKEHSWVKVNVEQTGFYRVKYDDKLAAQLRNAIEENCLSETDKFGVLDDTFALCEACQLSLSSLLSLMDAYRKEFDYILISRLIDVCYNVAHISSDAISNSVNELKQFFINLLLFSAEKLGWEPVSGERHLNTMLRKEVLMALATFGHSETHKEAMRRFQTFLDDRNSPLLSADTKRAAYIAVMRNTSSTNRTGYESLLKVYRESDGVQEKEPILRSLASCSDPSIVFEVLNLLLSDEIRDQDSLYVLSGISLEAHETAWSWLKENWDLISNKSGSGMQLTWYIKNIVSRLSTQEEADEVEAFFASRMKPTFAMTLKQNIEKIRIKARWVESIKQEQSLPELIKGLACRV